MTILLREVGGFLVEAALWILLVGAIGGLAGAAVAYASRTRPGVRPWLAAVAGAALGAALAHRLGIPSPWSPEIGSRPLPVVEAAVGGAIATLLLLRLERPTPSTRITPEPNGQHEG